MKIIIILAVLACLNSCAYTIRADGSRTLAIDGEQAAKAIIIYSSK